MTNVQKLDFSYVVSPKIMSPGQCNAWRAQKWRFSLVAAGRLWKATACTGDLTACLFWQVRNKRLTRAVHPAFSLGAGKNSEYTCKRAKFWHSICRKACANMDMPQDGGKFLDLAKSSVEYGTNGIHRGQVWIINVIVYEIRYWSMRVYISIGVTKSRFT